MLRIKCVILGECGVGKTSIINRYISNYFNTKCDTTLGASFYTKKYVLDNKVYDLDFWDTAGQERYRSLLPMYIRNSNLILLVYDTSLKNSLDTLKYWVNYIDNKSLNYKIIILGNKCDLESKHNIIQITEFTDKCPLDFYHINISAKTGHNYELLEDKIKELLTLIDINRSDESNIQIYPSSDHNIKKKCCDVI